MNAVALIAILIGATLALGWILNHLQARLAFVELALTNGLPTTPDGSVPVVLDSGSGPRTIGFDAEAAAATLPDNAVSIVASTSCVTCAQLLGELAAPDCQLATPLHVWFPDAALSSATPGVVHAGEKARLDRIGIPATPWGVVIRDGAVAASGPLANPARLQAMLITAGLTDRLPERVLAPASRSSA